ncbi:MAG: hypothetical protein M0T78_00935 [Actinomycetota bacterium]|nr:hypothetical protein [Actinomycetota bacterium]
METTIKIATCDEARNMVATNSAYSNSLPKWPSKPLTITGLRKLLRIRITKERAVTGASTYPGTMNPL